MFSLLDCREEVLVLVPLDDLTSLVGCACNNNKKGAILFREMDVGSLSPFSR